MSNREIYELARLAQSVDLVDFSGINSNRLLELIHQKVRERDEATKRELSRCMEGERASTTRSSKGRNGDYKKITKFRSKKGRKHQYVFPPESNPLVAIYDQPNPQEGDVEAYVGV